MKETAFITGITGQVGSQLADYLLEHTEMEVIGMMRWQESMDNKIILETRQNLSKICLKLKNRNSKVIVTYCF